MLIVKPISPDGLVGFDEFNQLVRSWRDGNLTCSTFTPDLRDITCVLCGKDWELSGPGYANHYYHNARERSVHQSCFIRHLAFNEYLMWREALIDAKIRFEKMDEIPNEYGGAWNTPWYTIAPMECKQAIIKVGSRKRVYHVELILTSLVPYQEALSVLDKEDVTKAQSSSSYMIHAWTEGKAKEYIKVFSRAMGLLTEDAHP